MAARFRLVKYYNLPRSIYDSKISKLGMSKKSTPEIGWLPSGKHATKYGNLPCLMGKSTISTGPFSIAM
jgi:hypothetical protein